MLINKNIYECELYSIAPKKETIEASDESKNLVAEERQKAVLTIKDAETEIVGKIVVQPTVVKNIFREIVTGKLITAYYSHVEFDTLTDKRIVLSEIPPMNPVYIVVDEYEDFMGKSRLVLKTPSEEEVKEYIETHDRGELRSQIKETFQKGQENYDKLVNDANIGFTPFKQITRVFGNKINKG